LLRKLQDRAKTGQSGELTAMHKINHLLDLWEEKFQEQIADGTRSPTSLDTYQPVIKNHVRLALGELRIGEANTPRVDTVISKIKKNAPRQRMLMTPVQTGRQVRPIASCNSRSLSPGGMVAVSNNSDNELFRSGGNG
jgi:hypothetical protein